MTEKDIPFPVVYTHHSHHQNQQASTPPPPPAQQTPPGSQSSGQASSSDSNKQSESGKKDVKDNSPADREPDIYLPDFMPDAEWRGAGGGKLFGMKIRP